MSKVLPQHRARNFLIASVVLTLVLYWMPFGDLISYPLVLLSTLAHELSHGLMAELVGGSFQSFELHSDGSGVTKWEGNPSRLSLALISGAGLVGPALAGAGCFVVAKRARLARSALVFIGVGLLVALVLVIRNLFGGVFVGAVALAALAIGLKAPKELAQLSLVFVGTQLSLSVFSRSDYLFTSVAQTANGVMPSDTAQIADALIGPYWLWGIVAGLVSLGVLWGGVWSFLKGAED
jgi:hypothetical protein